MIYLSGKKRSVKMANKFNIRRDLLGGQFLSSKQLAGQWVFIIYIFFLIFLYITINLAVIKTHKDTSRVQRELKNLKADYTSKEAKLQAQSSRGQIKLRLQESGSTLKDPTSPAYRVKRMESKEDI